MATANEITQLAATLAQLAQTLAERDTPPEPPATPDRTVPDRVLLTAEEAAERLGIGRTTTWKLIRTGELESVQIGRLRRIHVSAIRDYAAQLVNGTPTSEAA